MSRLANTPCPCGSGAKLKRCCAVTHHRPTVAPPTLMRARYVAYAIGHVDFLIATTHPDGPHFRADRAEWRDELSDHCRQTHFTGLTVHDSSIDGDTAWVTFTARLDQDGVDASFSERSRFERVDGRWLYHSGEVGHP